MSFYSLDFAFALGQPLKTAIFRQEPEDFIVDELLAEPLSGEGEHLWLHIKKRGENTDWVNKKIANYFSVRNMDVGYGGKKDRHAVTSQWFSVYLPGQAHDFDWQTFNAMAQLDAELLGASSHTKKFKKGEHLANRFEIRLRNVELDEALIERLVFIKEHGVPNYFGEQRFGRGAANLEKADRWAKDPRSVKDRNLKGILMSSARSYLFNKVLSERVSLGNWQQVLPGDTHPEASGPLWGRGRSLVSEETLSLEEGVLAPFDSWSAALENVGLSQERRPLCLRPEGFSWRADGGDVVLNFILGTGQYATSILRELVITDNVSATTSSET